MLFSLQDTLSRIRVPLGFALAGTYFYFSQPTRKSLAIGGSIAFLGILIRAWATGHLRKNDQLIVTGPYAFTRNPLYFGSFLIGTGFSLAGDQITILVVFLASFATIYTSVMHQEMNHMKRLFPEAYASYQQRVPIFFPRLFPWTGTNGKFSLECYRKNQEYRALLGFLSAVMILVLKVRYR